MSRQRKSKFNAISAEQGNELRGKALDMVKAHHESSRGNASPDEQMQAAQRVRNQGAAQEGMRQRDIRQKSRTVKPVGNEGMHSDMLQKVASGRWHTAKVKRPMWHASPRGARSVSDIGDVNSRSDAAQREGASTRRRKRPRRYEMRLSEGNNASNRRA